MVSGTGRTPYFVLFLRMNTSYWALFHEEIEHLFFIVKSKDFAEKTHSFFEKKGKKLLQFTGAAFILKPIVEQNGAK